MAKTGIAKTTTQYITDTLGNVQNAADAAMAAGYPKDSRYTQAYLAGVPYLYKYGDAAQKQALDRTASMYQKYGDAGQYNKTNFSDLEGQYGQAGQYDAADFANADYSTANIQNHMSPYEELVSKRAQARLKKGYDEARGERESSAVRQGAFGGSGAAVQEELARRNYLEQADDMNARNLQAAFESGADLYGREFADNFGAQQAEESSRQFAKNAQFSGLEGQAAMRGQTSKENQLATGYRFDALNGQMNSAQQEAQLAEQQKNMQLANLSAMQQAGQQQEATAYNRNLYDLNIATTQANAFAPLSGGVAPLNTQKPNSPSLLQQAAGAATAAAGVITGLQGASGGLATGLGILRHTNEVQRYVNGGLAGLSDPMGYYQGYNQGGIAMLPHNYEY